MDALTACPVIALVEARDALERRIAATGDDDALYSAHEVLTYQIASTPALSAEGRGRRSGSRRSFRTCWRGRSRTPTS